MDKPQWVAFFSQTGEEIVNISQTLGRWPDVIVTNERPEELREIHSTLERRQIHMMPNKPTLQDYIDLLMYYPKALITLHGWLRIIPPEICERHAIYNGHPGLITKYPELKGKDPQIRAFEGKYETVGCVLHKVTAGVDEGDIIDEEQINAFQLDLDGIFRILKDRSLYMWCNFLQKIL